VAARGRALDDDEAASPARGARRDRRIRARAGHGARPRRAPGRGRARGRQRLRLAAPRTWGRCARARPHRPARPASSLTPAPGPSTQISLGALLSTPTPRRTTSDCRLARRLGPHRPQPPSGTMRDARPAPDPPTACGSVAIPASPAMCGARPARRPHTSARGDRCGPSARPPAVAGWPPVIIETLLGGERPAQGVDGRWSDDAAARGGTRRLAAARGASRRHVAARGASRRHAAGWVRPDPGGPRLAPPPSRPAPLSPGRPPRSRRSW